MTERRRYLTPRQKTEIIEQQGGMCTLCGEHLGGDEDLTEFDHSRPLWALGTNDVENMQLLCAADHLVKTREEATWRASPRPSAMPARQASARARANARSDPPALGAGGD